MRYETKKDWWEKCIRLDRLVCKIWLAVVDIVCPSSRNVGAGSLSFEFIDGSELLMDGCSMSSVDV